MSNKYPSDYRGIKSRVATLSAIGFLEAVVFGLSQPVYVLNLRAKGYSETEIGINAAFGGLGVFVIGPFVPWLIWCIGYRNYSVVCFMCAAGSVGALAFHPGYAGWCISRLLLGIALGSLWILTEAWLNDVVPDSRRGRANSVFQFCYSIGFMAGPAIIMIVGFSGRLPLAVMAAIAALGGIMTLASARPPKRTVEGHGGFDFKASWRARSLVVAACVAGLVETALYTMLPVFGQKAGHGAQNSLALLIALSLGAILMAIPLGFATDRRSKGDVLTAVSAAASASVLLLYAGVTNLPIALIASFLCGGTIIGMYCVSLVMIGEQYAGGPLASVATCYSMSYALGTTAGGVLGGASLEVFGPPGLPSIGFAVIATYTLYLNWPASCRHK